MPRFMADICQPITSLHEVVLFAVSPHCRGAADRLLEVGVDRGFLLGVQPLQRNGARAVHPLHIPYTSPHHEYSEMSSNRVFYDNNN